MIFANGSFAGTQEYEYSGSTRYAGGPSDTSCKLTGYVPLACPSRDLFIVRFSTEIKNS